MATQGYGQAGRGIGNAISAFFDPRAQQAGEMSGLQQAALGERIQQGRLKSAALAREEQLKSPQSTIARVLMGQGIGAENAPAVETWMNKGTLDRFSNPDAGPTMPAPEWYAPAVKTRIGQGFAGAQAVQAGEAKDLKDYAEGQAGMTLNQYIAKALAENNIKQVAQLQSKDPTKVVQSDLMSQIASGALPRDVGGGRMAAIDGKPLYNADATGAVLDQYGGALDTSNPMAGSTINLRTQQGAQAKAGAAENYAQAGAAGASAENYRASAAKTRMEIADGRNGGGSGKLSAGYRWKADGSQEPIPGGPADPVTKGAKLAKPPTEGQAKALMFGSRMAIADEVLNGLDKQGKRLPNMSKQALEGLPAWTGGPALAVGANFASNEGEQQIDQAQRDFINAVLRRESGAAIADTEFANARKQYFAQPGDSPAVLRQKAANRQTSIGGMKAEFGEQSLPEFNSIVDRAKQALKTPANTPQRQSGTVTAAPVPIASDADYAALPSGTRYQAPDGSIRTKK